MKKVHSKAQKAKEQPQTPLHFKLEIKGTKADIELHGKGGEMAAGIASAMSQKPDLAGVIMKAATYFTVGYQNENSTIKPEK